MEVSNAGESPATAVAATQPSQANDILPTIDLNHGWFSKRASWLTLDATGPEHLKLYYSYLPSGPKNQWLDLAFVRNGSAVKPTVVATPGRLDLQTAAAGPGSARIILSGERDALIESSNLGIQISPVQKDCRFDKLVKLDPQTYQTSWLGWNVAFVVLKGTVSGSDADGWHLEPEQGECRMAIRIFKDQPSALPTDWNQVDTANVADWRQFRNKMPAVADRYVAGAEQAWLTLWYSMASPASPNFPIAPIFMAKARMNSVWPWDHCFNALALGTTDVDAGLDQWMLPFNLQRDNGQIPDKTGAEDAFWGCTKPPIHGWALGKLMDMHPVSNQRLEAIYPKLVKWTNFWFTKRDKNQNGIPGFSGSNFGWESGWDNSTVAGGTVENEAPELQVYLILQMQTLARVADQLGRKDEANQWRNRAANHLALFRKTYWIDGQLVTRLDGGRRVIQHSTSLEPMMSLALGQSMDKDMFNAITKNLDAFTTEYGLASEMPTSPDYKPDGYWRGPIWAPAMYLIIDGLNRGGRRDLAVALARRYDLLIRKAGGYYENFDAQSGKGLRTKAYTWSAAVHILLLHEYTSDLK